MNNTEAKRVINRTVRAYRQGSASYQGHMDKASVELSDTQWQMLLDALEAADKQPALPEPTSEVQARLEGNVARCRKALEEAERELYAFYSKNHIKKH